MNMKVTLVAPTVAGSDGVALCDNASLAAAVQMCTAAGMADITIVAPDPDQVQADLGLPAVRGVLSGAASLGNRDSERWLRRVVDAASGRVTDLNPDDPVLGLVNAIAAADALVIVAGSVPGSLQPQAIYEYAALTEIAHAFSKPIFMSAQGLNAALTDRHRQLLSETLDRCSLVGLGNPEARSLAVDMTTDGSRFRDIVDDTMFVGDASDGAQHPAYCAVATQEPRDTPVEAYLLPAVAQLLDHVVASTGLDIVHVVANPSESSGDFRDAARIVRGASMIISSRCEPLAFAVAGSVPAIGIYDDVPTGQRMVGLLGAAGQANYAIPAVSVPSGHAALAVDALWASRQVIAKALTDQMPRLEQLSRVWWEEVASILRGDPPSASVVVFQPPGGVFPPALGRDLAALSDWQRGVWKATTDRELAAAALQERAELDGQEILRLEREFAESQAAIADLEYRLSVGASALSAAQQLVSQVAEPLYSQLLRPATGLLAHPEFEPQIAAIMTSRTFRWTRRALDFYGAIGAFARRAVRVPGR